jgi:hypothetical protein
MLQGITLWMTIAGLCTIGCSVVDDASAGNNFGLTEPIRLAWADIYLDGGTVSFILVGAQAETLRGGFDGRMQEVSSLFPRHCYIGDAHPSDSLARMLPLWGPDERALIRLLKTLLADSLSSNEISNLLSIGSAMRLPRGVNVGLWHLVRAVDGRQRLLKAIDKGFLTCPESTLTY